MARPVERWLGTFMCSHYADTFEAYGYKTLQSVCQLSMPQLQAMRVQPEHCSEIMENVSLLRQSYMGGMPAGYADPRGYGSVTQPRGECQMPANPIGYPHGVPPQMAGQSMPSMHPQQMAQMSGMPYPRPGMPHPGQQMYPPAPQQQQPGYGCYPPVHPSQQADSYGQPYSAEYMPRMYNQGLASGSVGPNAQQVADQILHMASYTCSGPQMVRPESQWQSMLPQTAQPFAMQQQHGGSYQGSPAGSSGTNRPSSASPASVSAPQNVVGSPSYQPSISPAQMVQSPGYYPQVEHSSSASPASPLASLQRLAMLPDAVVVDPKSVVSEACLSNVDGTGDDKSGDETRSPRALSYHADIGTSQHKRKASADFEGSGEGERTDSVSTVKHNTGDVSSSKSRRSRARTKASCHKSLLKRTVASGVALTAGGEYVGTPGVSNGLAEAGSSPGSAGSPCNDLSPALHNLMDANTRAVAGDDRLPCTTRAEPFSEVSHGDDSRLGQNKILRLEYSERRLPEDCVSSSHMSPTNTDAMSNCKPGESAIYGLNTDSNSPDSSAHCSSTNVPVTNCTKTADISTHCSTDNSRMSPEVSSNHTGSQDVSNHCRASPEVSSNYEASQNGSGGDGSSPDMSPAAHNNCSTLDDCEKLPDADVDCAKPSFEVQDENSCTVLSDTESRYSTVSADSKLGLITVNCDMLSEEFQQKDAFVDCKRSPNVKTCKVSPAMTSEFASDCKVSPDCEMYLSSSAERFVVLPASDEPDGRVRNGYTVQSRAVHSRCLQRGGVRKRRVGRGRQTPLSPHTSQTLSLGRRRRGRCLRKPIRYLVDTGGTDEKGPPAKRTQYRPASCAQHTIDDRKSFNRIGSELATDVSPNSRKSVVAGGKENNFKAASTTCKLSPSKTVDNKCDVTASSRGGRRGRGRGRGYKRVCNRLGPRSWKQSQETLNDETAETPEPVKDEEEVVVSKRDHMIEISSEDDASSHVSSEVEYLPDGLDMDMDVDFRRPRWLPPISPSPISVADAEELRIGSVPRVELPPPVVPIPPKRGRPVGSKNKCSKSSPRSAKTLHEVKTNSPKTIPSANVTKSPSIHIVGKRSSPKSCTIVNGAEPQVKSSTKVAKRFHLNDSIPYQCVFCEHTSGYAQLGDLFGPYNVENMSSSSHDRALPCEMWMHEDCVLWCSGVYMAAGQIYGLDDAVSIALQTICSVCRKRGAMIGCLAKGCQIKCHYTCAQEKDYQLDKQNFSLLCHRHKGRKLKMAITSGTS